MNVLKKTIGWFKAKAHKAQALCASLFVGLAIIGQQAHASLPQTVSQAIEAAKADGLEAGWLVIGVVAALFVIAIVRRLLR